jgi:hypothetical protein
VPCEAVLPAPRRCPAGAGPRYHASGYSQPGPGAGGAPANLSAGRPGPVLAPRQEPDTAQQGEDPGYLTETGQAAGEDGSVAPIIGGLPAVEGSAWDIGAPLDERGAGLADELGSSPGRASGEDARGS